MRKFLFGGLFLALACMGKMALADSADPALAPAAPVSTPLVFVAATPAPTPIGGPTGPLGLTLSVEAGYTTVNMSDLNGSNAAMWGYYDTQMGHYGAIHDGAVIDLNLMASTWTPYPWLEIGLRAEYLRTGTSELQVTNVLIAPQGYLPWYNFTDTGSMVSGLLGFGFSGPTNVPGLNLGVHAWAGPGFGRITQQVTLYHDLSGGPQPSTGIYSGQCIQEQLEFNASYQVASNLSFSFSGGWRWADLGGVKDSSGRALYEIMPALGFSAPYGVKNLAPVNVDFSGATASGGVSYSF
ncbi:MAG TPA: hypothetical protein VNZ67_00920 [bacterium]|nr:hypothetical protein [bacterium]